jgi:predicted flap endonuclease-1-like 5' DNA nuclease
MLDALLEYWVYIAVGVAVVALAIFLLTDDNKQHIDIADSGSTAASPTLDKGNRTLRPGLSPYPYKYTAPQRSPLPRDNLLVLKGVGPRIAARLDTFNFTRYEHIAVWKEEDYVDIADMLGEPVERIIEDRWVEQCRLLAAERFDEYEAEYGKINQEDYNRFKDDSD